MNKLLLQQRDETNAKYWDRDDVYEYDLKIDDNIIGFLMLCAPNPWDHRSLNLFRVEIYPEYRGHKYGIIGIKSLQAFYSEVNHIWLYCEPSLCLYYASIGFVKCDLNVIPSVQRVRKPENSEAMIWKPS